MDNLENKILLNSGRNCLRFLVKAYKIKEINVPYYICPVVWHSLQRENVKINFYHIDKNFMPVENMNSEGFVLYPNYFGICGKQSEELTLKYPRLILDNAHAFFAEKRGLAAFYSPRKFFNVNDGGILDCDISLNEKYPQDDDRALKITDFDDFCKNELSIDNQPIKLMSNKTYKFLKNVDFLSKIEKKRAIFDKIHQKFADFNDFKFSVQKNEVPMIYPLKSDYNQKIADLLVKNCIYVLRYWSNLPKHFTEAFFQNELLCIPITEKSLRVIEKYY